MGTIKSLFIENTSNVTNPSIIAHNVKPTPLKSHRMATKAAFFIEYKHLFELEPDTCVKTLIN